MSSDDIAADGKDALLRDLLQRTPPPQLMAIAESGLFLPTPAGLPVAAQSLIRDASSILELVVPADILLVIGAWELALESGVAHVTIHLLSNPQHPVELHFVDARRRYGAFIGVVLGSEDPPPDILPQISPLRPRVTMMRKSGLAVIEHVDAAVTQILGWTPDEMLGRRSLEFLHPDDHSRAIANWMDTLRAPGADRRVRLRHRHRDGYWLWLEITNHNLLADPANACVLSEMVNISDEMLALETLRSREQLLLLLTEALPLGILQVDAARRIVHRNKRLAAVLGRDAALTLEEQFSAVDPADLPVLQSSLDALFAGGTAADIELTLQTHDVPRRSALSMRALTTEAGDVTGAIMCVSDITERARLYEELELRATYDALTKCQNRASILAKLDSTLRDGARTARGLAILYVDLDHFKEINDRHGHGTGDIVLQRTGERLLAFSRVGDAVGRLGGDEFLVVCPDVPTPESALEIARRISVSIAEKMPIGGILVSAGSSIGVVWTDSLQDCTRIVAAADAAMYESKRRNAGRPVLVIASGTGRDTRPESPPPLAASQG